MIGYGGNNSGAATSSAVGASTANAGSSALGTALQGLTNFNPSDPTQANIADAAAYANNPATDGMITAAMRDATRSVSEGQLPQLARSSALSGNTMSSKNALTQGVIARGLADKTADVSSQIRVCNSLRLHAQAIRTPCSAPFKARLVLATAPSIRAWEPSAAAFSSRAVYSISPIRAVPGSNRTNRTRSTTRRACPSTPTIRRLRTSTTSGTSLVVRIGAARRAVRRRALRACGH
jgi:hypothetical protein